MKSNILTFCLSSVAMLASSYSLMAADADLVDSPDPVDSTDILEILWMGGFMMYPLAVLSVICVVLILFYFFTIRRNSVVSDKFMSTAEALIRKRDYLGLVAHCHKQNQSVARITEKTLDFMTKNTGYDF